MAVVNGSLYVGATKGASSAYIFKYNGGGTMAEGDCSSSGSNYRMINNAAGKIISGDTANINGVVLHSYNGHLYAGSITASAQTAGFYEYDPVAATWTLLNTSATRGDFASDTLVNDLNTMVDY